MDQLDHARGLRDFMLTYNKIVDNCFSHCIFSFNSRQLLKDEEACIENCTQRSLHSQTRLSRTFADIQVKKMEDSIKENQKIQNQEQLITQDSVVNQSANI